MSKSFDLFDSFTFNVTLSFVSLAVLADQLVSMIAARSITPGGARFVIWIVIAFHFISVAYKEYRHKQKQESTIE